MSNTTKLSDQLEADGDWGRTVSFELHVIAEVRTLEVNLAAVKAQRDKAVSELDNWLRHAKQYDGGPMVALREYRNYLLSCGRLGAADDVQAFIDAKEGTE